MLLPRPASGKPFRQIFVAPIGFARPYYYDSANIIPEVYTNLSIPNERFSLKIPVYGLRKANSRRSAPGTVWNISREIVKY